MVRSYACQSFGSTGTSLIAGSSEHGPLIRKIHKRELLLSVCCCWAKRVQVVSFNRQCYELQMSFGSTGTSLIAGSSEHGPLIRKIHKRELLLSVCCCWAKRVQVVSFNRQCYELQMWMFTAQVTSAVSGHYGFSVETLASRSLVATKCKSTVDPTESRPSSRTDRFVHPASHLAAASVRPSSVTTLNTVKSVFRPQKPVYLATVDVRSLKQSGQQVALARTLDSLCIDVCCLSETRTQDASTVIELTAPSLFSRFRLRTSGDAGAAAAGYAG
ncbi:hypothetical protein CLF_113235, partial [Clonorchis sinensis]